MTLREAAQAMEAALNRGCHLEAGRETAMSAEFYAAWDALTAALSLPDPGGWAEGRDAAETMKEALAGIAGGVYEDATTLRAWARDTLDALSRLPVPPATTAPEPVSPAYTLPAPGAKLPDYQCLGHDRQGRRCLLQDDHAALCRFDPAVPEAKPAESEVGWIVRFPDESLSEAMLQMGELLTERPDPEKLAEVVRIRLIVEPEPAPVEPEETP